MSTKPLTNVTRALIGVLLCLLASGCVTSQPERFPDTDIVYEAGLPSKPQVGYINADGSNSQALATDTYVAKPVWSADGKTLYVLQWSGTGVETGYISTWREGKARHVCKNYWAVTAIGAIIAEADSTRAVVNNAGYQLLLVDLERCLELKKYVDVTNDKGKNIMGGSLSSDGKRLLYAEVSDRQSSHTKYTLKILDIDTGGTSEVGEGTNPAWSPDAKWITYIKLDGIYVMASDGSQPRRLIEYNSAEELFPNNFASGSPSPRWSPDGKWVIYHRCAGVCKYLTDSSIFKVEVATGKETKIVEGGAYPFWRSR